MSSTPSAITTTGRTVSARLAEALQGFRLFGPRGWIAAIMGIAAMVLLIGLPTAVIDNPVFGRMEPVRAQDYVFLGAAAILGGLVVGTFAAAGGSAGQGGALSGGFLSFLAVGCPTCNAAVVLLVGTSGALTFFAPAQLFIGLASLGLLAWVLGLRLRAVGGPCEVRGPR